jgi:hypothetical protein
MHIVYLLCYVIIHILQYRRGPLLSTPLWTQTHLDAVNIHIANILNKKQEPAVLQLRILADILKIFLHTEGQNTYCFKYCNSTVNLNKQGIFYIL